jgi:hypothetical protein
MNETKPTTRNKTVKSKVTPDKVRALKASAKGQIPYEETTMRMSSGLVVDA